MTRGLRLLSIEDDVGDDLLVRREIQRSGLVIDAHLRVDTLASLAETLRSEAWDVCISDFNLRTFDALDALAMIAAAGIDLPTLVVTGTVDDEVASAVYGAGARDLVSKNKLNRLGPAIVRELKERDARLESRRTAARLRESEVLFGLMAENSADVFWLLELAPLRLVYVSPAVETMWGIPPSRLYGDARLWAHGIHPGDRERVRACFDRWIAGTAERFSPEYRVLRPDGSTCWVLDVGTRILGEAGQVVSVSGIARDITDRVVALAGLRTAERRFRALAEAAGDAIVTLDASARVVYSNGAAERLFQRPGTELMGMDVGSLTAPESRAHQAAYLSSLLREPHVGARRPVVERDMLAKDGSVIPVEVSVGPWELDGERFVTGILRDLTARRELEAQLRHAQKMEAFGQLAGGIAHDFNNILGAISNFTELIGETLPDDAQALEDLDEIMGAVGRGAALVRQLLAFSRKQVLRTERLDLGEVARGLENLLRRALGAHRLLALQVAPSLPEVRADRGQIEQVLMNLVVNAKDAVSRGGRVRIEVGADDEHVILTVQDDGAGMDVATQGRVFEPFFTTKDVGKGTGLGLSTVYAIVHGAGGRIDLASEPGGGTTFEIRLPALPPSAEPRARGEKSEPEGSSYRWRTRQEQLGHGEIVVLVEDEPTLASAAARTLRRAGYRVIEVPRAEDALAIVDALGTVRVVVSEVRLPEMDGLELADALARRPFPPGVVLVSDAFDDAEAVRGMRGVVHMEKPLAGRALSAAVRTTLDAAAAAGGTGK